MSKKRNLKKKKKKKKKMQTKNLHNSERSELNQCQCQTMLGSS